MEAPPDEGGGDRPGQKPEELSLEDRDRLHRERSAEHARFTDAQTEHAVGTALRQSGAIHAALNKRILDPKTVLDVQATTLHAVGLLLRTCAVLLDNVYLARTGKSVMRPAAGPEGGDNGHGRLQTPVVLPRA